MHGLNEGRAPTERTARLTEGTVKIHATAVYKALGVSNRTALAHLVVRTASPSATEMVVA